MDEMKKLRRDFGPDPATNARDASGADRAAGPWAPLDGAASGAPTAVGRKPADAAGDDPTTPADGADSQPTTH